MKLPTTLQLHGRVERSGEGHPYLFRAKKINGIFVDLQREMAKLNDFCVVLNESIVNHSKHSEKASYVRDPRKGSFFKGNDDDFVTDVEGYWPEDVGVLFGPASSCTLLYLFVIRFLRELNIHHNVYNYQRWTEGNQKRNRKPELVELIELLQVRLNKNFNVLDDGATKILLIDRLRSVRNSFMHGDWEGVEELLVGVNLPLAFKIVSEVFSKIEANIDEEKLSTYLRLSDPDHPGITISVMGIYGDGYDDEEEKKMLSRYVLSYFDEELGYRVEFPAGSEPEYNARTLKWEIPSK